MILFHTSRNDQITHLQYDLHIMCKLHIRTCQSMDIQSMLTSQNRHISHVGNQFTNH